MFSHQKKSVTRTAKNAAVVFSESDDAHMKVGEQLVEKAGQILPRGNAADRPGQNVVEHQRRDGKFRQRPAQRFLDHAVHAAAHEHAAAFDVHRAHAVGEQHDAENEPGRRLPDEALGFATRVVGRGGQVVQDNRGRAPKGDERQHGRRGHDDAWYGYKGRGFRALAHRCRRHET